MQHLIDHLMAAYTPTSIIVYGSYANGTQDPSSDFDALIMAERQEPYHDTSVVEGVQLDVFVYPAAHFDGDYDCNDFVQIFDGRILLDQDGRGRALQQRVLTYLAELPRKSEDEIRADMDWCLKMLERCKRGDAEGLFRWHWLLTESLEIFFEAVEEPYFGPKKALKWMQSHAPEDYACYTRVLSDFSLDSLEAWIGQIVKRTNGRGEKA